MDTQFVTRRGWPGWIVVVCVVVALGAGLMFGRSGVARALAPTATPTATVTGTPTSTATRQPTMTGTLSAPLLQYMTEQAAIFTPAPTGALCSAQEPTIIYKPGQPVTVQQTVIVPVQITSLVVITTTPGPTQTPAIITATPGPTQTPWVIWVEVTSTPTATPTATPEPPTPTPTSLFGDLPTQPPTITPES